ncbi:hypothetical protein DSO57_1013324 [Entomophthora muscae]|uniref:Uncharacterized protein n=1 Tax=Entomophthora muscae TaxID=34485 RepID=A0ACC2UEK7_9FUNG|nr:hypothetical protein DSO57_1013324 [Entomophthora muscae]
MFPPGSAPVTLVKPPCAFDLEFFYPYHLDLPPGYPRFSILPIMEEIPLTPPCPRIQQVGVCLHHSIRPGHFTVPHNGSWRPLATVVNYLVRIAPIVYMTFQTHPTSPEGVQPDSGSSLLNSGTDCTLFNIKFLNKFKLATNVRDDITNEEETMHVNSETVTLEEQIRKGAAEDYVQVH